MSNFERIQSIIRLTGEVLGKLTEFDEPDFKEDFDLELLILKLQELKGMRHDKH